MAICKVATPAGLNQNLQFTGSQWPGKAEGEKEHGTKNLLGVMQVGGLGVGPCTKSVGKNPGDGHSGRERSHNTRVHA